MPFSTTMLEDSGSPSVVAATPPPAIPAASPPPPVDTSDAFSRAVAIAQAAPPPPTPTVTVSPDVIAAAEAAGAAAGAGVTAALAGGSAADIAAAEAAAGATPEVVQTVASLDIPGTAGIDLRGNQLVAPTNELGLPLPADVQNIGHDEQTPYDLSGLFPDLNGRELDAVQTLSGEAFIDYVRAGCYRRNLDALAVLADSYYEGLRGGIGDHGTSYGPWQLHDGGALPRKYWGVGTNVARIQSWAWSAAGIDYALDAIASTSARGKTGAEAMHAIVYEFEKPASRQQQYVLRYDGYLALKAQGDKVWATLASYVRGPQYGQQPTSVAPTQQAREVTTIASWRDLVTTLRDDVPASGVHMQNTSRRLVKAVT